MVHQYSQAKIDRIITQAINPGMKKQIVDCGLKIFNYNFLTVNDSSLLKENSIAICRNDGSDLRLLNRNINDFVEQKFKINLLNFKGKLCYEVEISTIDLFDTSKFILYFLKIADSLGDRSRFKDPRISYYSNAKFKLHFLSEYLILKPGSQIKIIDSFPSIASTFLFQPLKNIINKSPFLKSLFAILFDFRVYVFLFALFAIALLILYFLYPKKQTVIQNKFSYAIFLLIILAICFLFIIR